MFYQHKRFLSYFFITVFLLAVLLCVCFIPNGGISYAENTDEFHVIYSFGGDEISDTLLPSGTTISSPITYKTLAGHVDREVLIGKEIEIYDSDTNEKITFPYVVSKDVTFDIRLVGANKTVKYVYYYGNGKKEEIEYLIGSTVTSLSSIDGKQIVGLCTDGTYSKTTAFASYADQDREYYPVLDENVGITFNGENYAIPYGTNVKDYLSNLSGTHDVKKLYTDEEKTTETNPYATYSFAVYGEYERTHYSVTFSTPDGSSSKEVFIPIENPYVDESVFPEGFDAVEWRFVETERVNYPITIDGDITLYSSNGLNNPVTETDKILLYIVAGLLLAMAGWGALYEHRKTKRKRLATNQEPTKQTETTNENCEISAENTANDEKPENKD